MPIVKIKTSHRQRELRRRRARAATRARLRGLVMDQAETSVLRFRLHLVE